MKPSTPESQARLLVTLAKAEATQAMLHVVDESLKRSAEARREHQKAETARREKEDRDRRAEEADKRERRNVEEMRQRLDRIAKEIAEREAARTAASQSLLTRPAQSDVPLDVVA